MVVVLIGAMFVTRDMGPLLIAGYAAGAFVAASVAMWWHQRIAPTGAAFALAVALFVAWILATTVALFELGSIDDVTAARLESLAAPLASANDQLALVSVVPARLAAARASASARFRGAATAIGRAVRGVPAQIQSDYTFTALVGVFGWTSPGR